VPVHGVVKEDRASKHASHVQHPHLHKQLYQYVTTQNKFIFILKRVQSCLSFVLCISRDLNRCYTRLISRPSLNTGFFIYIFYIFYFFCENKLIHAKFMYSFYEFFFFCIPKAFLAGLVCFQDAVRIDSSNC
jgi:hypothetical protein